MEMLLDLLPLISKVMAAIALFVTIATAFVAYRHFRSRSGRRDRPAAEVVLTEVMPAVVMLSIIAIVVHENFSAREERRQALHSYQGISPSLDQAIQATLASRVSFKETHRIEVAAVRECERVGEQAQRPTVPGACVALLRQKEHAP